MKSSRSKLCQLAPLLTLSVFSSNITSQRINEELDIERIESELSTLGVKKGILLANNSTEILNKEKSKNKRSDLFQADDHGV